MLEIVGVFLIAQAAAKAARAKGRSGWWGAIVVGLWFGLELPGAFITGFALARSGMGSNALFVAAFVGLACGAVGGWIGYTIVKGLTPLAVADAPTWTGFPPPAHVFESSAPAKKLAGFCAECGSNVWLAPDGSCCNGHPSYQITGIYSSPAQ
jgi:hypothetical protein